MAVLRAWTSNRPVLYSNGAVALYGDGSLVEQTPFYGNASWDMMWILVAAATGKRRLVRGGSRVYDVLWAYRDIYETLKPFIRLTKPVEAQLLAHYVEEATKTPSVQEGQPLT